MDEMLILPGLRQLVLLNISHRKLDDSNQIPQPRLVFLVRHMVSQLSDTTIAVEVITEIYKSLTVILPLVKEVYEPFWQKLIDTIVGGLSEVASGNMHSIPFIHASLKLCAILQTSSTDEDSNDDLKDSWAENKPIITDLLVKIMKLQACKLPRRSSIVYANVISRRYA